MVDLCISTCNKFVAGLLILLLPSLARSEEGHDCANPTTSTAFVDCALTHDRRVLETRLEYEKAVAVRKAAGLWANPVLDGEALYPPTGEPGYRTSAGLLQPLALSGWRGHAVRSADYRVAAARIRLEAVRWQVAAETMIGLVRLRQAGAEMVMLEAAGRMCDVALDKSGKLAFLTDEQDTARQAFIWRREAIRSRASRLKNEVLELKEKLTLSIGGRPPREWDCPVPFRTDWPGWPVPMDASPAIAGLKAEAEAAKEDLKGARAGMWPDVSVGPFMETEPGTGAQGNTTDWGARISLALPLFDRNQGRIAEAGAERKRAEEYLSAGQLTTTSRLKSLESRYKICVERLREYGSSILQGKDFIETIKSRYTSGRVSASVVLEAIGSYLEAVEETHGLERETYATFWEGTYLSGSKEMPLP
jgi:cobalt-zinc-cadmium efflux system outer membrane protein